MTAATAESAAAAQAGRSELGTITIADGVVSKIAARAAAEDPDAGVAAALIAASVIVIIEVIAFIAHAGPVVVHWPAWYRWAARTHWNALVIKVWSVILIIAGAIVLAFELKPRRVTRLKLGSDDKATDAAVTRK